LLKIRKLNGNQLIYCFNVMVLAVKMNWNNVKTSSPLIPLQRVRLINLALAKAGFEGPLNLANAKISCKLNR
jgi:hypothetical protein